MSRYEEMRFDFDNAVRYGAGRDPWATYGLALANFHLGRNDTAKPLFLEAKSKIDKDLARREIAHYLYAIAVRQDDADAARRYFNEAPVIGINMQSLENRCQIVRFAPDSLASMAGALVGDILLSIDSVPIQSPKDAVDAVAALRFGDTVPLQVERDKKPRSIDLVLDYRYYRTVNHTGSDKASRKPAARNEAVSQEETPAPIEPIPDSRKFKLAVMEFQTYDQQPENSRLGSMIGEMFTTEIVESRAFRIVEREQLEKVLKELKVAQSGIVDTTQAQKVGKMVGAAVIVTGSVMKVGDRLRIDSRIIEVETGVIVSADSRLCTMDLDDLTRAVAQMTGDLAKKFYRDK
jgi:TolB-like protein